MAFIFRKTCVISLDFHPSDKLQILFIVSISYCKYNMGNKSEVHDMPSSYALKDVDTLAQAAAERFADEALHKYYLNYYKNYYAQQMGTDSPAQPSLTNAGAVAAQLAMQQQINTVETPAFSMPSENDGKKYRKYLFHFIHIYAAKLANSACLQFVYRAGNKIVIFLHCI